eukprot:CAMPEP_0185194866 /NCGR_PEP_ID=MMETSP1140-20130426/32622_1 /TAXON_ID=298111 /ORGANISM="Pavlova sp., Strain CCMP459" /LENGTH=38 /DNA_ID= /DNA_START= /DNA_END= /DNA_ORIENTATION=
MTHEDAEMVPRHPGPGRSQMIHDLGVVQLPLALRFGLT